MTIPKFPKKTRSAKNIEEESKGYSQKLKIKNTSSYQRRETEYSLNYRINKSFHCLYSYSI